MNRRARQRGVALLIVLIALVFMTLIAVRLSDSTTLSLKRAERSLIAPQLRWMLMSAENAGLQNLSAVLNQPVQYVSLTQPWARPVSLNVAHGTASARILSGQNCLNLNVMSTFPERDDGKSLARNAIFQTLVFSGLNNAQASKVIDTFASRLRANKNAPLLDIYALKQADGMAQWRPSEIAKWLCTLPDTQTLIAINLLTPEDALLLQLLSQNQLSVAQARQIITARPAEGWRTIEDVQQALHVDGEPLSPALLSLLSVEAKYFIIDSRATLAGQKMTMQSAVMVDKKTKQITVWKRRLTLME